MVFLLRHVEFGETLILGLNRTYTLGRSRRNDIHLTDLTVNNSHAKLDINEDYADIEDRDSDYGTWVNKTKITEPFRLRNGDVIVFGKANCKYVFLDPKFEAVVDKNISQPTQCMLAQTFKELNVTLSKKYTRKTTHYVVETVSLDTLKEKTFLYNLVDRNTIIIPKYFGDILTNIKEAPLMPNIYRYMPEIDNNLKCKGIEDISPRKKRRHIFDNVVFIFFDKQHEQEFSDIILKCGGDALLYSEKRSFFEELFRDMNRFEYIAVNHSSVQKQLPTRASFLRSMRQKRKPVSQITTDNIYISVLKGDLVGAQGDCSLRLIPKDPQPCTSKTVDVVVLESSDDDISDSEPVAVNKTAKRRPQSIKTFSRLATAYKKQKTLKETFAPNHSSSSTLNRWISSCKKKDTIGDEVTVENGLIKPNNSRIPSEIGKLNDKNRETDNSELTDDETHDDLEVNDVADHNNDVINAANIESRSTNFVIKRRCNKELPSETEERVENVMNASRNGDGCNAERVDRRQARNGKRKSVVLNPFAKLKNPRENLKRVEEKQDGCPSHFEDWKEKYKGKGVEITEVS